MDTATTITVTEALGYRQEYRRLAPEERGYRRRVTRLSDGTQLYAGPGTDSAYPPVHHPEWTALPREERLAIRAVLDAADELTGIADYLSERAGRDAVAREAATRGIDARAWRGREADDARREASQVEYEHVLDAGIVRARDRLGTVVRRDRDVEATRRLQEVLAAQDLRALAPALTTTGGTPAPDGYPAVRWRGEWLLGVRPLLTGLLDLAGLQGDGSLGLSRRDEVDVAAWRARARAARGCP